ncbi:MAG: AraC family transcriptional regulator [Lachnospiraceae bacterium]|nr:AraC family transcriptional regulator [Lachnospiraceae bacterium]
MPQDEFIQKSYHTNNPIFLSLYVYNVGFQTCDPNHTWGPGIRNHYLIHYIHTGKGYYKTGEQTFLLTKGDAFLIYPETEVSYYADEKDPWEYYWVGFHGTDAAALIHATDFSKENPVFYNCTSREQIRNCFLEIYQSRGNTLADNTKMTGSLYHALSLFIQDSTTKQSSLSPPSYIELALSFIASQYTYSITIEDIAAYLGISRSHLFREFKEHLNQSPKDFLTSYRIREACRLLTSTSLSIQSIANSVGYENGMYFSRIFHQKTGLSPSQFRIKNPIKPTKENTAALNQ